MASTPKPRPIPDRYRRITPFIVVDGHIVDPFGHHWTVANELENVAADELMRRMADLMKDA